MRLRLLLSPLAISLAALAACGERQPSAACGEETKRCVAVETRDAPGDEGMRFQVRLSNLCTEDVEYKLCFETRDGAADCRQNVLARAERAEVEIALDRFAGRSRLFLRFAREAKACRFPLTSKVRF